jgi:hypothetical protein
MKLVPRLAAAAAIVASAGLVSVAPAQAFVPGAVHASPTRSWPGHFFIPINIQKLIERILKQECEFIPFLCQVIVPPTTTTVPTTTTTTTVPPTTTTTVAPTSTTTTMSTTMTSSKVTTTTGSTTTTTMAPTTTTMMPTTTTTSGCITISFGGGQAYCLSHIMVDQG